MTDLVYDRSHEAGLPNAPKHPKPVGRPPRIEDRYIDSAGYAHIRVGGRFYPEHRVVMMAMLGRPLFPGESVHHKNGQRADNRTRNLELWVGPIRKGARASDLVCHHCGEPWIARQPRSAAIPLAEVTARITSKEWPVHVTDAPPGFFERFRKPEQGSPRHVAPTALWKGRP